MTDKYFQVKDNEFFTGIYDTSFKSIIFGRNKEFRRWFVFRLTEIEFKKLHLEPTELPKKTHREKGKRADMIVNLDDEYIIDIEVYSSFSKGNQVKSFMYGTSILGGVFEYGESYADKPYIIVFDITAGIPNKLPIKEITEYKVRDADGTEYLRNFEIFTVNVAKIMKYWYNKDVVNIDKYCHIIMLMLNEKELDKLVGMLTGVNKEQVKYFKEELIKMNSKMRFRRPFSKEKMDEIVRDIDRKEAKKEGIEEGITEGILANKINNAKNMLRNNLPIDLISKCVDLSLDEVRAIEANL